MKVWQMAFLLLLVCTFIFGAVLACGDDDDDDDDDDKDDNDDDDDDTGEDYSSYSGTWHLSGQTDCGNTGLDAGYSGDFNVPADGKFTINTGNECGTTIEGSFSPGKLTMYSDNDKWYTSDTEYCCSGIEDWDGDIISGTRIEGDVIYKKCSDGGTCQGTFTMIKDN